jgi:hypothetical protein
MYYAYKKSETFRGTILGLWEAGKTVFSNLANAAMTYLGGLGDIIGGIFNLDFEQIKKGFTSTLDGLKGATFGIGEGVADSFNKGYLEGIKPLEAKLDEIGGVPGATSTGGKTNALGLGTASKGANTNSVKASIAGVQSDTKSRTLNVSIEKIVENLTSKTTNLQESRLKLEDAIRETLVKAVRDVEYIAG